MKHFLMHDFRIPILRMMKARKITKAQLAERMGVPYSAINHIFRMPIGEARLSTWIMVSRALNLDPRFTLMQRPDDYDPFILNNPARKPGPYALVGIPQDGEDPDAEDGYDDGSDPLDDDACDDAGSSGAELPVGDSVTG